MSIKLVKKHGKECFVIDTRPSKAIRRAKARSQKRGLEIHKHFSSINIKKEN